MKIQCNVCGESEAMVVCCADEAALCLACDEKVHKANKLASKHQRVSLCNSSSKLPNCDICQDMVGYFFCLEDRALLCRKCDFAIHTANAHVSAHQRFLLTGAKVGLQSLGSTFPKSHSGLNISSISITKSSTSTSNNAGIGRGESLPFDQISEIEGFGQAKKPSFTDGTSAPAKVAPWQFDDFFGIPEEFNQNYGSIDHGKSKGGSGEVGDSRAVEEADTNDSFGQVVPETYWTVPQIPSQSGFFCPTKPNFSSDGAMFVPDSYLQTPHGMLSKKQRR